MIKNATVNDLVGVGFTGKINSISVNPLTQEIEYSVVVKDRNGYVRIIREIPPEFIDELKNEVNS